MSSHFSGRPASRRPAGRRSSRRREAAAAPWQDEDSPLLTDDLLLVDEVPPQRPPAQNGPVPASRLSAAGDVPHTGQRNRAARRKDGPALHGARPHAEADHGLYNARDRRRPDAPKDAQSDAWKDARSHARKEARPDNAQRTAPRDAHPADRGQPRQPAFSPWREQDLLLPLPNRRMAAELDQLGAALARVRPLGAVHARSLPEDVARLSRLLTVERAGLHQPYWASPALTSAYLYYFLPWNVLRQMRLLAAMPLPDPRTWVEQGQRPVLLDLGSGPLSLPLALWLARPEWRTVPLEVVALDNSPQPLELGRALFQALGDLLHEPVWTVRTVRAPLGQAARQLARLRGGRQGHGTGDDGCRGSALWLVSAANVLNELLSGGASGRAGRRHAADDDLEEYDLPDEAGGARDDGLSSRADSLMAQRLESLMDLFEDIFEVGAGDTLPPSLLVVEPGTRLGGATVMRLRSAALDRGLVPLAPCTHGADCPLERGRSGRGWCHFTFDCSGAPSWLTQLAGAAGLEKASLSLAPLLLSPGAETLQDTLDSERQGGLPRVMLRVLSAPFAVPGLPGRARYACGVGGLALLAQADALTSGGLLEAVVPQRPLFDRRSGALLLGKDMPVREPAAGERSVVPERRGTEQRRPEHSEPRAMRHGGHGASSAGREAADGGRPQERPARGDRPEKRRAPVTGRPAVRRGGRS
ncbi:small ribosomal subunit Rsm22 family protein [uncultured Desulfovibrio sp.]|uniref:small ribosomal subunit Rsm22 family protein n=1 Tax=uncultured Desulfovibrio sp. TaxID=167968 RepID=UPI00261CB9F9|nr:small ribosomal subunit Rsm22 family protein [uncultured Desulfovibrio sp.]